MQRINFPTRIKNKCKLSSYWCLCLTALRDADGDVDQCPMWTFPTVRPNSMNKLQKGYTHTDSEVRDSIKQHTHTDTDSCLLLLLSAFHLFCQSGDSVKRQPKSQCLSALVTPIFREVGILFTLCHDYTQNGLIFALNLSIENH